MKKLATLPETAPLTGKSPQFTPEYSFDDECILDMDYFVKTLSTLKSKGVRPDLIGSMIAHYASKWVPDLTTDNPETNLHDFDSSSESITSAWLKKKFYVETLVGIFPPEINSIPCHFLLRVLRVANMLNVEPTYGAELERRIAWQLDQATLKEIMIPLFSHKTSDTLLDIELVIRLVKGFISNFEEGGDGSGKSGGLGLLKVAKLVDCYLAEVAVDANLKLSEFFALGVAIPCHARATDDGLYRAIDTYLKAHPTISKQARKNLCTLIDSRKLSQEASHHASQNERLPVRSIIQVIFSEQNKSNRNIDWSSSFSRNRSPTPGLELPPSRCPSKRQVSVQQLEIKKLKEDITRLQTQCNFMQAQLEKIGKKKRGVFQWIVKGFTPSFKNVNVKENVGNCGGERGEKLVDMREKFVRSRTTPKRRSSMS